MTLGFVVCPDLMHINMSLLRHGDATCLIIAKRNSNALHNPPDGRNSAEDSGDGRLYGEHSNRLYQSGGTGTVKL